jgi:hypothetical protein
MFPDEIKLLTDVLTAEPETNTPAQAYAKTTTTTHTYRV